MEKLIAWALVTLVSAFVGSYLGAYLKRKGENLATHEDLDKLVEQVRAVTTTTKEIEAKISSDVWDQQKRWELKRDAIFDAMKKTAAAQKALTNLYAIYRTEKVSASKGDTERVEKKTQVYGEWNEAASEFDQASLLVALSCGAEVQKALLAFGWFCNQLSQQITEGRPEAFAESAKEFVAKREAIMAAMRKEIEVDNPADQAGRSKQ